MRRKTFILGGTIRKQITLPFDHQRTTLKPFGKTDTPISFQTVNAKARTKKSKEPESEKPISFPDYTAKQHFPTPLPLDGGHPTSSHRWTGGESDVTTASSSTLLFCRCLLAR